MTIHSEWAKIFYQECPSAFLETVKSSKLNVGIIDGHLQLMCLNEHLVTWERFIQSMFLRPIEQMFKMGCKTVVVCFDSYDNVPVYKNMTQLKRSLKKEVCTFDSHQSLPSKIPEDTMKYLMNRIFKVKLIQMLCERLPTFVKLSEGQKFIIDYKTVVCFEYNEHSETQSIPILITDMKPMGESDVKFTRYIEKFGNALVHAIDGDYMIIALLYYAKFGLKTTNKMYIYRQCQKSYDTLVGEKVNTKRKIQNREEEYNEYEISSSKITHAKEKKRKCWIDMQMIYVCLLEAFQQSLHKEGSVLSRFFDAGNIEKVQHDYIHAMVFLVLCAGTDFSRQLPLIGPQRLWDMLPLFSLYLVDAIRDKDIDSILNVCISKIYQQVFSKHIKSRSLNWKTVYENLSNSTLSPKTKSRFPNQEQLTVTIKNILWVMQYWATVNNNIQTPLDGSHGYLVCKKTGQIIFEDLIQLGTD